MDTPFTSSASFSGGDDANAFPSLRKHLRDQELTHIHRAIECSGGDKKKAALLLHISLATLYRKLEGDIKQTHERNVS